MTFVNRLAAVTPSMGSGIMNDALFLKQSFLLSGTVAQTNVLPASGSFVPTISKGKLRVKFYATATGGTTPAVGSLAVVFSDGTNYSEAYRTTSPTMTLGGSAGSATAPNFVDRVADFELDINATTCSIVTTLTGTSPQMLMDVEISGTT